MTTLKILAGFVLLLVGAVITLPLPEFGIPLVLIGLRLLGERYAWARRANARLDATWAELRRRFHALPAPARMLVVLGLAALAVVVIWFGLSHL